MSVTVVPSVRSELLRDGIEDFEKFHLLREALASCKNRGTTYCRPLNRR